MPVFGVVAASVPYDNTASGLAADNVQDAIDLLSSVITGLSPMRPLYSDALGDIAELPSGSITTEFGPSYYIQSKLDTTTESAAYRIEDVVEIDADATASRFALYVNQHFDRQQTGFDTTGQLYLARFDQSHEGGGSIEGLFGLELNVSIGNGTDPSFVNNSNVIGINHYAYPQATFGNVRGIYYNFNAEGDVTGNFQGIGSFASNTGEVLGTAEMFTASIDKVVTGNMFIFNAVANGSADGFNGLNINSAVDCNYANLLSLNNSGDSVNGVNGIFINQQGNVGQTFFGFALTCDGDVGNGAFLSNLVMNGDTTGGLNVYGANVSGNVSASMYLANFGANNTADEQYGTHVNLQGSGTTRSVGAQVFVSSASPSIYGLQVSVNSATSTNRKTVAEFGGGSFSSFYEAHTGDFTFNLADSINSLGGTFWIDAGSPLSGGEFIFGNNIGFQVIAEDDMGVDVLGGVIGFSMNALVGQVAIANTKTIDTFNFMLTGASVPDVSGLGITDGGTISHLTCYRAVGLLPQGGTLSVTNVYGFRVESFLSAISPTNAWGLFVDDSNADNYFAKCLNVGATTKKVANNDVAIEVGSVKTILNGRGTTAQKNAFTALAGMQFFDTDLAKLQWYDGATWHDMGATGFIPIDIQEIPAGLINGANVTFTMSQLPISDASVSLFQSGRILVQGVDYTLAGSVATLAVAPLFAQTIYAAYKYGPSGPYTEIQEAPAGAIDNANVTFTLSQTPAQAAGVCLYLDGMILFQGVDYTIAGAVITIISLVPNFAQTLYATYRY